MKQYLALLLAGATAVAAWSAVPQGYYDRAAGKSTSQLKTALHEIINPHTEVSSYSALPSYFQKTDLYPESSRWWDMYSTIPLYAPSFKGLNREHSFPKSWWGGATDIPAYVDLNHLYPAESAANMAKSNYPLGVVTGSPKFDNGWSTVGRGVNSGGAPYVFEPADEYKGDFARTYFYMVTCYQDLNWKYEYMARTGTYPSLQNWAIDLLLEWHRKDGVSQKEIDRNEAVYRIQNNRNPFIDYPELAEYIWGNRKGESFMPDSPVEPGGEPTLITPVQNMTLDFGQTAIGSKSVSRLFLKGENLTGQLELSVSGTDAAFFSPAVKVVDAANVNSSAGYWLNITYTPTALGTHSARLRIQDGGLTGSIGIELKGECLPKPVLTKPVAVAATDITSDSYQANWLLPDNPEEVIDYYIVTRTVFRGGEATTSELTAEENYLVIDGFNESDSESYTVSSVRLGYRSEPSSAITVSHAGIDGAAVDSSPLAVESYDGFVRFRCGEPHENVSITDMSGKIVMIVPVVSDGYELELLPGIYLVRSASHAKPLKIVVR